MADVLADLSRIDGFHAHVYYAPHTRAIAARLRNAIGKRFRARLGSWHDGPVTASPTILGLRLG